MTSAPASWPGAGSRRRRERGRGCSPSPTGPRSPSESVSPTRSGCTSASFRTPAELAVVGTAADCGGAIDSLLAGLALRLGRDEAALEHAHAGLALERRAGARTWIPRTAALVEQAGGILVPGPADP